MRSDNPASPDDGAGEIEFHSARGRWVLGVAIVGSGMVFLDSTIVNVALPAIGREFDASTSALQWIINGYLLALASLILLGGALGDRFGRRRVFVAGAGLFTAASLLCAIAPSVGFLIAARFVQGIGGALLTPGSLAMIEASFRSEDRTRAIGAWSGLTGVVSALGPLLGGYLIGAVSWRAAFLINLPLGAFVAVAARHVPETRDPTAKGPLDVRGAVLAALALGLTTYALVDGPGHARSLPIVLAAGGGLIAFAAFIVAERRSTNPMLPLSIFASRQFTAANVVTFVVYAAIGGLFFLFVSFLQISLHYSPVAAGAALLPQTAIMLLLSTRAGALTQRIGPRIPLTVGPGLIAAGMLLMTRIGPGDSYVRSVLPAVIVFALGVTLVASPVTATALAAVDASHAGLASGINNAVSRVGNLLAVAVLPVAAGITGDRFYDPAAMTHGFRIGMVICAVLAVAGGAVAWLMIGDDALSAAPESRSETRPVPVGQRADAATAPAPTPEPAATRPTAPTSSS